MAMPLLEDGLPENNRSTSLHKRDMETNSSPQHEQQYAFDGNDSLMNSVEEMPTGRFENKNLKRNLTPLEIQTYAASPMNKYASLRSVGSSTSDEQTGGLLRNEDEVLDISSEDDEIYEYEIEGIADEKNTYSYSNFLKAHSCYDIVPNSSKIIVFDSKLKVKKAFFALVHNNLRSAPVWSSPRQEFVGMLTITDFIKILIRYYKSPLEKMWELEEHQIETWRELTKKDLQPILIRISPKESIFTAVQTLVKNRIHRLPVIDPKTGNSLYILTHKKILRYIFNHIDDLAMPDFMGSSLEELRIGTYSKIATIHPWTTVIEALRIFADKGVSALPIVDDHHKCVDIYSKFDVINLAAERTYNNLDGSVQDALSHRQEGFEGVHKCQPTESLYVIIDRIANAKVHRLVVVNKEDRVLGIVSLSDILRFLVLQPPKMETS
ncbi:5'-AMP-activated protein kinase subunit gamma-1-like isoform X2 [Hydractinia symbiolongicarpus]|nr:5'-AMP-activated protein kinase subunit gamma-1-like isoform X2 [Hydractinia symbiolongicarpus]